MGEITVKLTSRKLNSWEDIDEIFTQINYPNIKSNINFDFTDVKLLTPTGLISLIILSKIIFNITQHSINIINIGINVLIYLEKSDIKNLVPIEINNKTIRYEKYKIQDMFSFMRKIKIIESRIEMNRIAKEIEEQLSIWFPNNNKDVDRIKTVFIELCANSLEHSEDKNQKGKCYFTMQKYQANNEEWITIITGDLGIGIRNHIEAKYGIIHEFDYQYIEDALELGFTGRKDDSGGMGLKKITDTLKVLNGKMIIKSLKGINIINSKGEFKNFDCKYSTVGTQIKIEFYKKYIDIY